MRHSAAAIALTIICGLTQRARAESNDDEDRRAVAAVIGFGTPVGLLGVEGSYRIRRDLELSVGLGVGLTATLSNALPIQWSVMPRYRIGNRYNALTLGLGFSGGNYSSVVFGLCASEEDLVQCNTHDTRYTLWANVEIGGEHVGPTGVTLRYFVGYGRILAQGAQNCTYLNAPSNTCPADAFYPNIPYLGVSLGHSF